MQPFGDHLRAEQNIDFARPKIAENPAVIFLALERIRIHARDAGRWEKFRQNFLDLLRADTCKTYRGVSAFRLRTDIRRGGMMSANVANKLLIETMIRQGDTAIRTTG